jgi:hypothetical protein
VPTSWWEWALSGLEEYCDQMEENPAWVDEERRAKRRPRTPLSPAAQEARRPPPPETLVDARQDRVHRDVGKSRPARATKVRRTP